MENIALTWPFFPADWEKYLGLVDNLLRDMWEIQLEIHSFPRIFVFGLSQDPRPCQEIAMIDTFCVLNTNKRRKNAM